MNRVVGWELSFTEDFVVIPTVDLEIQLFVGLVIPQIRSHLFFVDFSVIILLIIFLKNYQRLS
ncbi:hypothetical protein, partial [Leptospira interrogans]|uniref:hypothetical protein n=1 Tax=Leptospira interrogans TaxID=173 RepID=UPI001E39DDF2